MLIKNIAFFYPFYPQLPLLSGPGINLLHLPDFFDEYYIKKRLQS
jgi:hypothetical protein